MLQCIKKYITYLYYYSNLFRSLQEIVIFFNFSYFIHRKSINYCYCTLFCCEIKSWQYDYFYDALIKHCRVYTVSLQ